MVYIFLVSAVMIIFRVLFNYKNKGMSIIKKYNKTKKPFIICSNHISNLDPIFIVMGYGYKKLTIMGKAELFKNPFLAWLFTQVGAFPVERGKGDLGAIDKAVNEVKSGKGMLIFPEGTRTPGDEMIKIKAGALMVAAQTGADIIPVRVIYDNPTRSMRFFSKVRVVVGQPLLAQDLNLTSGSKIALRAAKETLKESFETILQDYNNNPF